MEHDSNAAVARLDIAQAMFDQRQPTKFWVQCVRDASGKWQKYEGHSSRFGVKYFRGHQPDIDYQNPDQLLYFSKSIEVRRKFYESVHKIAAADLATFISWLEDLRRSLEYRPVNEWLHQRFATTAHTIIIKEEILKIASHYNDPYMLGKTDGPIFSDFPKEALPYDKKQGDLIEHHYPTLKSSNIYFSSAHHQLKQLMTRPLGLKEYIYGVATFFQLLINLHYFAAMNASLYMNIANGLLELKGIEGIENGIIDFVALRLQPNIFQKYFYDEVTLAK